MDTTDPSFFVSEILKGFESDLAALQTRASLLRYEARMVIILDEMKFYVPPEYRESHTELIKLLSSVEACQSRIKAVKILANKLEKDANYRQYLTEALSKIE